MKMKKIWAGGHVPGAPLDQPMHNLTGRERLIRTR